MFMRAEETELLHIAALARHRRPMTFTKLDICNCLLCTLPIQKDPDKLERQVRVNLMRFKKTQVQAFELGLG